MTSKVIWYIQRERDGGDLMQSILIQLPTELKSKQSVFLLDAATASNTNTALKIAERLPRQKHEVVDNNSALLSHSVRSPMQPASRRASDEKALSAAAGGGALVPAPLSAN